ncbi:hypothetical protein [Agromyces seonyuensis]|uniref:Uncharacterized protein n=1 Tax=Agromyces seonyuensis TaxID=2662446 RepID=A0A6I4P276_9MICO|nr:hypothetical protein [Agromyces seonyuensis]MWB98159.1 hypothetical protein [Agromyces seonyuensis]
MGPETRADSAAPIDPILAAVRETPVRRPVGSAQHADALVADLSLLDLRLSVLLGRFEHFTRRPEPAHRAWVDDTRRRMHSLTVRARALRSTGRLGERDADRARTALGLLEHHIGRLEGERAAPAGRRTAPVAPKRAEGRQ